MKPLYMVLRLSRRALAAVSVDADDLRFFDGRHLPSNSARALRATTAYVEKLLTQLHPDIVAIDAPVKEGSLATALLTEVQRLVTERNIRVERLSMFDVLSSFGVPGLQTRTALHHVTTSFWPALATLTTRVKPYLLEAAAAAEYMEVQQQLGVTGVG